MNGGRDKWENGAPERGKSDAYQQQVVEQEDALTRDYRVKFLLGSQPGQTENEKGSTEDDDDGEKYQEKRTDV